MPSPHPIYKYPIPKRGLNLYKSILDISPEEAIWLQNLIYRNGLAKRGGQKKQSNSEVNASDNIVGLHRFYKSDGTKQLIAVSDTDVRYDNSGTWTAISTGQTADTQTFMTTWGPLDEVYVANGTDDPFKWDGTTKTQFSAFSASNIPSTTALMFLPYQDRLLVIEGGDLRWSGAFIDGETGGDNWETVANCGVRPDTKLNGMIVHSQQNSNTGYESQVLLAGNNGMYIFRGTDLRVPFTTGDYRIFNIPGAVACNAPRTMQWTPAGSMWLGVDRQVYLLPFGSATPIPVSDKIRSNTSGLEGIELIPAAQISKSCAIYHDGFYKLSITSSSNNFNNRQFWLDVNRLFKDEDGQYGPWYGPMLMTDGTNSSGANCYVVQSGAGDVGELITGESNANVGSYVYIDGDRALFGDNVDNDGSTNAQSIQIFWQSFYNPLGNEYVNKQIVKSEAVLLDVLGTVNVDYHDITGSIKTGDSFGLSGSAIFYDDDFYDDGFYSNSTPTRQLVSISPGISTRRLSMLIKHGVSTDRFEIYDLSVEARELGRTYEDSTIS